MYHIVSSIPEINENKWYVFQKTIYDFANFEYFEFETFKDAEEYFIWKLNQFNGVYVDSFDELRLAIGSEILKNIKKQDNGKSV